MAAQLAQAMETERAAKARKVNAERDLDAASAAVLEASANVERLLEKMREARS